MWVFYLPSIAMKFTRFAQARDASVKDMWRRVHLLNLFVLKFHVVLNFEPCRYGHHNRSLHPARAACAE